MRRLGQAHRSSDDMLIIRGVNCFRRRSRNRSCRFPALAGHYQIEVSRQGTLDNLTIRVELRSDAGSADPQQVAKSLAHKVKAHIGVSAAIDVRPSGSIPRSVGKAVRIIDHRKL